MHLIKTFLSPCPLNVGSLDWLAVTAKNNIEGEGVGGGGHGKDSIGLVVNCTTVGHTTVGHLLKVHM